MAQRVFRTVQVTFLGGAGEYARTCILLERERHTILLDCGVDKSGQNNKEQYPLLTKEIASSIDLVLLSHAHQDHSSALPYLYALGYRGKVFCSEYTKQQVPNYLASWVKMNQQKNILLPFEEKYIDALSFETFKEPAGKQIFEELDLFVEWGSSGHILGSVWYDLQFEGAHIFFSGDYHTESALYSFVPPQEKSRDLAILDSAYGTDKISQQERVHTFKMYLQNAMKMKENILLPLPKFGRSQEVLLLIKDLIKDYDLVLEKDILSPLFHMKNEKEWLKAFHFDNQSKTIKLVSNEAERREVLERQAPKIIVTPDGMMESERAQFYFHELKKQGFFHVLFTGHVAQNTFGAELLETASPEFEAHPLRIKVHPNLHETHEMILKLQAKQIALTHNFKENNDRVVQHFSKTDYKIHSLKSGEGIILS